MVVVGGGAFLDGEAEVRVVGEEVGVGWFDEGVEEDCPDCFEGRGLVERAGEQAGPEVVEGCLVE